MKCYSRKKIKKQRPCKPGYVVTARQAHARTGMTARHLSWPRTGARSVAVYPPAMGEQPLNAGILDLATHKTCGTPHRCGARWALTPPFHPYRGNEATAVVFCHAALPSPIAPS